MSFGTSWISRLRKASSLAKGMGDKMNCLENKTLDTKRKMDMELDEMKPTKSRHATVDINAML